MPNTTRVKQLRGDTAGSVLFIGAGGHATEDNTGLFWDNTNNRLGIGTAVPSVTLDVRGGAIFNEDGGNFDFRVEGDTDPNLLTIDAGLDSVFIGTASTSGKLGVISATISPAIYAASTATGTAIGIQADATGTGTTFNVGITASASGTTSGRNIGLTTTASNSTTGNFAVNAGTWGTIVPGGANDITYLGYNGNSATSATTTRVAYFVNGQTNTANKIGCDIALQSDQASGTGNGLRISNSSTFTAGITHGINVFQGGTTPLKYGIKIDSSGGLTAGTNYGLFISAEGGALASNYAIYVDRGTNVFNGSQGDWDFQVKGDTDPNLLYLDASTDSVGIGTATPSSKLHVVNSITDSTVTLTNTKTTAVNKYGISLSLSGTAGSTSTRGMEINVAGAIGEIDGIRITNTSTGSNNTGVKATLSGVATNSNTAIQGLANGTTVGHNIGVAGCGGGATISSTAADFGVAAQLRGTRTNSAALWVYNLSQTTGTSYGIYHNAFFNTAAQTHFGYHMTLDRICTNNTGLFINVSGATSVNTAITTQQGGVIFNEAASNSDFRVEGVTDANLLFVDASTDNVGIGTNTPSTKLDINGSFATRPNSPAAIVANTNDYTIPAFAFIRISSTGAVNITGLANGVDGRIITLVNVGANTITLTHQDALSVAANRMINKGGLGIALVADAVATFIYDATTARWRHTGGTT